MNVVNVIVVETRYRNDVTVSDVLMNMRKRKDKKRIHIAITNNLKIDHYY